MPTTPARCAVDRGPGCLRRLAARLLIDQIHDALAQLGILLNRHADAVVFVDRQAIRPDELDHFFVRFLHYLLTAAVIRRRAQLGLILFGNDRDLLRRLCEFLQLRVAGLHHLGSGRSRLRRRLSLCHCNGRGGETRRKNSGSHKST